MASPLFGNIQRRLDRVEDDSRGARMWKCAGSMGSRNSGGTSVFTPISRLTASSVPKFPFQVKVVQASSTTWYASVNTDSTVMKSLKPNDNLTVVGLGVTFPFIANDVVALYIVVSGLVAISAMIQSYGMGTTSFDPTLSAWDASDDSYVFNDGGTPPNQIGLNILLAYSTPITGGLFFVQAQTTHVLLENCDIDGEAAIFDFSHRERYGITSP